MEVVYPSGVVMGWLGGSLAEGGVWAKVAVDRFDAEMSTKVCLGISLANRIS